jgi:hypothetical protein
MQNQLCVLSVKQARWLTVPEWVGPGDAPADCLADLRTNSNALSVYFVPSDDWEALGRRVALALSAKRQSLDTYDYALFDAQALEEIAIHVEDVDGTTPDPLVNKLHKDLVELSAMQIGTLAGAIRRIGKMNRIHKPEIRKELAAAIGSQRLDRSQISEGVLKALGDTT